MAEQRSVAVNGITITYRESGVPDGPPLVLLHALGESAADWENVRAAFEPYWRVYALDMRGHADSDWPGDYAFPSMARDVLGFLDAVGLDRVDMIAHSMGGTAACLFAEDHADRLNRLVLEDIAMLYRRNRAIPDRPDGPLPFDWDVVVAVRTQIGDPDPVWAERVAEITVPTLVIGGGPDSHIPQELVAELAKTLPDGRLVTIEAGHHVHRNAPTEFIAAVLDFLRAAR